MSLSCMNGKYLFLKNFSQNNIREKSNSLTFIQLSTTFQPILSCSKNAEEFLLIRVCAFLSVVCLYPREVWLANGISLCYKHSLIVNTALSAQTFPIRWCLSYCTMLQLLNLLYLCQEFTVLSVQRHIFKHSEHCWMLLVSQSECTEITLFGISHKQHLSEGIPFSGLPTLPTSPSGAACLLPVWELKAWETKLHFVTGTTDIF